MMTISVIVGSTRQGRFSEKPAQWILEQLRKREGIEARLLDLRDFPIDLNYLFTEMLGNITLGHVFIGGGDRPEPPKVKIGLLGADYAIDSGRYRFAKIYNGENWNPHGSGFSAPGSRPATRESRRDRDGAAEEESATPIQEATISEL
jgi:hypothetical protein